MKINMARSISVVILIAALGAMVSVSGTAQKVEDPGVLLRAAIEKEEVDGDLPGAIELYKQIVAKFGESRAIAAQALLRLGGCYEKLGEEQSSLAQKTFEKLVADYPDQKDAVSAAKAKLAAFLRARTALEKGGGEHKITKIHEVTGRAISGWLSPDGTRLVLNDENTYTLSIRDLSTGQEVCLIPPPEPLTDCFWSPDGKLIAYAAYSLDIKIVPANGGPPRTLLKWDADLQKAGRYIWPMGWAPDSRKLIFQVMNPPKRTKEGLYAIPVQGGGWEEIYKFPDPQLAGERDEWLALSPDGRLIAFPSTRDGNQDIYIMSAAGGGSVRITDHPANDKEPAWSYDGRWLAFDSDRTGRWETWVIGITSDGKPGSAPVQATRGGAHGTWTKDGRIAYTTKTGQVHIFIADTGGSGEIQLTKLKDLNISPRWSPDGKTMAFAASYGTQERRTAIWTMPVTGGDEKFLAPGTFPAWSPDGKQIAFGSEMRRLGESSPHRAIISIVPAGGGEPRELMNYHGELGGLDWSPDGRHIVFSYHRVENGSRPIPDSSEKASDIYVLPVTGGEPRRLTRGNKNTYEFMAPCWSPDGKRIAFLWMDREGVMETGQLREPARIFTMDVEGGDHKLVTNEDPTYWLCWSRDGGSIFFPRAGKEGRELHKVPAEGGKAESLNIKGGAPAISPDGKKIAFYRPGGSRIEFWLAENFLPAAKEKK
jgi:Tol biopolymer transport system component